MRHILLISFLISLTGGFSQDEVAKTEFALGLDYLRTSQVLEAFDKNKVAPYFTFSKKRLAYGFGITFGQRNIIRINSWSNNGRMGLDGGFIFMRFFPNSDQKEINLFFEANFVYLHSRAEWGNRTQSVHTTQHNFKVGYQINVTDGLSINLTGGPGIARNVARQAFNLVDYGEGAGGYHAHYFYRPIALSLSATAGVQYRF